MKETFTESELLSLMAQDNKDAFEVIYRKYWKGLYVAALKRLNNKEQAEDIVEDIFIRFWEKRACLKVKNLKAYLYTAVRYKVYNYISRDVVSQAFYEPFEAITVHPESADSVIIEKELQQLAEMYIEALPPKRKKIFTLYFDENLSTREIAERLKVSQKTVQNQLGNAINGLRAHVLPPLIGLVILLCCIR